MTTDNTAFVGSIPENYDQCLGSVLFEPYAADLVTRLKVPEEASVLELACGTGILTRRLRDALPQSTKLVATDLNEAMINYAARKFPTNDKVEWKTADAIDLPFPDKSFDAVVCQFGLMFFPDKAKGASEAYRVLKPGGTFLFNVWDEIAFNDLATAAHETLVKLFPENPPDFYDIPFSYHENETIKALLFEAGFREMDLTVVAQTSTARSASDVAHGLIHGNPVITAIKERDESKAPEVEADLAQLIASRFGDDPVKASMRALVCLAVR